MRYPGVKIYHNPQPKADFYFCPALGKNRGLGPGFGIPPRDLEIFPLDPGSGYSSLRFAIPILDLSDQSFARRGEPDGGRNLIIDD